MRPGSSTLRDMLKGDPTANWVADVMLDGNRLVQDLPITNVSFRDDGTSSVQGSGSVDVVYQGDFADSIAPNAVGDALSPFGSQLWVYILVTAGPGFSERIPFGHYLISETPKISTSRFLFNQQLVAVQGDIISLELKDLFAGIDRDRFDTPGAAPSLDSVWVEYQRLTQLPVTRTVTDGAIPASVAYQDDKLQACYDLAAALDAVACMTSDGTASMRPNVWPAAVDTLSSGDMDPEGTLISASRSMQNDAVYNKVVIRDNANDGTAILATAEIQSGPLRTRNADGSLSPYRSVPYYYSSPFITTQVQAEAYAQTLLAQVSKLRAVSVDLVEKFNPLREVGDVLTVQRLGETVTARVTGINRSGIAEQTTTVAVNP